MSGVGRRAAQPVRWLRTRHSPSRPHRPALSAVLASGSACLLALLISATVGAPMAGASASLPYSVQNPLALRLQWDANDGYCGEASFVSAGLYYGQYLSQYDARALASNGAPQYLSTSQLLLGVNAPHAANQMHLTYSSWVPGPGATASSFLAWVKSEVIQGYPVIIGLYTNEYLFYSKTNPNAGDPSYDHIVVVTGISSEHPLTMPAVYYPDDVITFSDNGLWTGTPDGQPQFLFSYRTDGIQANRQEANAENGNIYSLPDATRDFGIAITGVADAAHETVPVRVTPSVRYERPPMVNGSNTRPAAMPLTLTVTASDLHPGVTYNLYRYDSAAAVPDGNFNAEHANASQTWTFTASSSTMTITQTVLSSDEVFYRAVPASAP